MEIRVEWSEQSERQLKDIFDYYSFEFSTRTARKIINKILDRVTILESTPLAGPKEELLLIIRKNSDIWLKATTKSFIG